MQLLKLRWLHKSNYVESKFFYHLHRKLMPKVNVISLYKFDDIIVRSPQVMFGPADPPDLISCHASHRMIRMIHVTKRITSFGINCENKFVLIVTFMVISIRLSWRWCFCHSKPTHGHFYLISKSRLLSPKTNFTPFPLDPYSISLGTFLSQFPIGIPGSRSVDPSLLFNKFFPFVSSRFIHHRGSILQTTHLLFYWLYADTDPSQLSQKVFGTCPIFCFTACLRNWSQGLLFWASLQHYLYCLRHVSIHGSVDYK